jgi:hypothetical protein
MSLLRPLLVTLLLAGASAASASSGAVDPKALPTGDGHYGSTPRVGWIDSCQASFNASAGGAQANGPWINASAKTWDYTAKLVVNGSVSWSNARYTVKLTGTKRVISFDDLPIDHTTGTFPIASSDPASAYDRNPNHIAAHSYSWTLPATPAAAAKPSCVGMGAIGVLADGVVLYNGLDGEGRDAGAHEVLDACAGHPDQGSVYHHHDVPPCILSRVKNGTTQLVGYALDGYGIYVAKDAGGSLPSDASLDACHGTTSKVLWNGKLTSIYHYVATLEFPYTVGCYRGTATSAGKTSGAPSQGRQQPQGPPPPPPPSG